MGKGRSWPTWGWAGEGGNNHESEIVCETDLLEMQSGAPPGNREGSVRQSSAQATARIAENIAA
jgi:hypothetical protein